MTCPRTVSTALAPLQDGSLWGARAPTDGGPRKSTNGLETEGGAMPRGEMAGAVEVNGLNMATYHVEVHLAQHQNSTAGWT